MINPYDMKLLLPIVLINCFCPTLSAQSLIVKGGIDLSTRSLVLKDGAQTTGQPPQKPGWICSENFSIAYEQHCNRTLSFNGGIGLTGRGHYGSVTINYVGPSKSSSNTYRLFYRTHYIDLPLTLKIRTEMGRDFSFYGYLGAYFGCALWGKRTGLTVKADTTDIYVTESTVAVPYKSLSKPRWDAGYVVAFGTEIRQFLFEASFLGGLKDLHPKGTSLYLSKNRVILFSLGYHFQWD